MTESLAKQIAESIRDAIVEGALKVDEQLPTEEDLARRYGVSRPTIREALKRLAAQNLIRSRRGPTGGTFVNRPSREESRASIANFMTLLVSMGEFSLSEIAKARQELEVMCCRLAAEEREQAQLDIMAEELEIQKKPKLSAVDFCASDVRFHRALVDAAQNPVLSFVMVTVIEALQPSANMVANRFIDRAKVIAQHKKIFAAVQKQNPEAAVKAMNDQMTYLQGVYAQAQKWRKKKDGA